MDGYPGCVDGALEIVVPISLFRWCDFREYVFEGTVDAFGLTISLRMISGCLDVMDLVDTGKGFDQFVDKFRSAVAGDSLGYSVSANYFFLYECKD